MATVTLAQGFFHLSSDLSTYIDLPINSISATEKQATGEVRTGVNGRRRIITRPGLASNYNFQLVMVDITDVELFRTFTNKEVLYRGPRGRKFYGYIPALSFNESPGPTDKTRGISFTMSDITKIDGEAAPPDSPSTPQGTLSLVVPMASSLSVSTTSGITALASASVNISNSLVASAESQEGVYSDTYSDSY